MARTDAQRARARVQREVARKVRNRERILPRSYTRTSWQAQVNYATQVENGTLPEPAPGTPEARQLARMASYARWNKADPSFEKFSKYFYHNKEQNFGPEAQTYEEGNTADVDEDE